jgi:hypothetical protein
MSSLRVNNLNIGGTSVDGVIQQVDSQGTANTAGNKITLKTDGTNTVDGVTTFNDDTRTKTIDNDVLTGSTDASINLGKVLVFNSSGTPVVDVDSATAGGILTVINQGSGTVVFLAGTATMYKVGDTSSSSTLGLAQHGMATLYYVSSTVAYISGVGLS